MSGTGSTARRAARRLAGEHEAGQVGASLGRGGHVLLARQAADLHERAREQLLQLRRRIGGPHQRRADENGVGARQLGLGAVGAGGDRALGDDDPVARGGLDELELGLPVDDKGGEIARVDPDHGSVELDRAPQLLGVVRLDERVEPELVCRRHQLACLPVVEVAQQQQHRVARRAAAAPRARRARRRIPWRAAASYWPISRRRDRRESRRTVRRRGSRPPRRRRARTPPPVPPGRRPAAGRPPRASGA